jgi:hypothetical protein
VSGEVKPGPCPACGCVDRQAFSIIPGERCRCNPCGFETRYVWTWNAIRARVFREAADYFAQRSWGNPVGALTELAERAERGEP